MREFKRMDQNVADASSGRNLNHVSDRSIPHSNHRDARTRRSDGKEQPSHLDRRGRFGASESDENRLRTEVATFIDRRFDRPHQHGLVPVDRKPIGKLDSKIKILVYDHDARPLPMCEVRHDGSPPLGVSANLTRSELIPFLSLKWFGEDFCPYDLVVVNHVTGKPSYRVALLNAPDKAKKMCG